MELSLLIVLNSMLLGIGLAMDAFSVSIANGIRDSRMDSGKICLIAGVFAIFQFAMPMAGWICVSSLANRFAIIQKVVPFIALGLLLYIGISMIVAAMKTRKETLEAQQSGDNFAVYDMTAGAIKSLSLGTLLLQGIATSIDALSVGFTISEYGLMTAIFCALIIGIITFVICVGGVYIGKTLGKKFPAYKAEILGGCILIGIGIEIFVKGMFF